MSSGARTTGSTIASPTLDVPNFGRRQLVCPPAIGASAPERGFIPMRKYIAGLACAFVALAGVLAFTAPAQAADGWTLMDFGRAPNSDPYHGASEFPQCGQYTQTSAGSNFYAYHPQQIRGGRWWIRAASLVGYSTVWAQSTGTGQWNVYGPAGSTLNVKRYVRNIGETVMRFSQATNPGWVFQIMPVCA